MPTYFLEHIEVLKTLLWRNIQLSIKDFKAQANMHDFFLEIEAAIYELAKSALIDAELYKFRQSLIVVAIISVALEIKFLMMLKIHRE